MSILTELVKKYSCISIVGIDKNVGKTTVLCQLIKDLDHIQLGVTSIGRDGESRDIVYGTIKPRIYIKKETIFATAKDLLISNRKCDVTKEILLSTNMNTPLGDVIIAKAKSDGYVDLAGPSINKYIESICVFMKKNGCEKIIIDGAISRISILSSSIIDGTILVTGASVSPNIDKVVEKTKLIFNTLSLKSPEDKIIQLFKNNMKDYRVGILDFENKFRSLEIMTTIETEDVIVGNLTNEDKYLLIKGIVTRQLLKKILSKKSIKQLTIVVEDGTKIFCDQDTLELLKINNIKINVINKINLIGIAYNPYSPYGYQFDENDFYNKLKKEIDSIPIVNVLGG